MAFHKFGVTVGAPGEIRTPDRPVRSRVLYPAELRARCFNTVTFFHSRRDYSGHPALHPPGSLRKRSLIQIRSRRICRTPDRPVRSRVLYPAELRARCFPHKTLCFARGANYPCEALNCQQLLTLISHQFSCSS